jgi:import inner membrane translocase subunit TIM10
MNVGAGETDFVFEGKRRKEKWKFLTEIIAKAMQNMYNRMMEMCFQKCIARFGEGELAAGEASCIDRCAIKYLRVQQKISIKLQSNQAQFPANPPPTPSEK